MRSALKQQDTRDVGAGRAQWSRSGGYPSGHPSAPRKKEPKVTPALTQGEEVGHRRTIETVGLMYPTTLPNTSLLRPTPPIMVYLCLVAQISVP